MSYNDRNDRNRDRNDNGGWWGGSNDSDRNRGREAGWWGRWGR